MPTFSMYGSGSTQDRLSGLTSARAAAPVQKTPLTSMSLFAPVSAYRQNDASMNTSNRYRAGEQYKRDMDWALGRTTGGSGINFGVGGGEVGIAPPPSQTAYDNPYERRLMALLDNPDSIANTGAYKFRLAQGQQALERSAAAKGMTGSGNTLAALINYGQGAASQAYDSERNALAQLTGQQNQFNLGQRGADTAAYSAQTGRTGTLGELALRSKQLQAEDYWRGRELALKQQLADQGSGGRGSSSSWGGVTQDLRGFW